MNPDEQPKLWNRLTNTEEQLRAFPNPPAERFPEVLQPSAPSYSYQPGNYHHSEKRGFAQLFGLHPGIAFLTFIVDSMLFGGEGVAALLGLPTGGASIGVVLTVSTIAACILGFVAYKAQQKWYGDDKESALIKAVILAFLTAIPTNIPSFVYMSAGIMGFFRRKH